jgi:hypothetical protein
VNADQFKEAYNKLQLLDERLTYKVRPKGGGMTRPSADQLEEKIRDLASYTVELKEVMDELFKAIAAPAGPPRQP